ncbi:hypothetical protein AX16_005953 [Volvariella volvacea WC 439]|nr:hypothetical protein AX16_005953 [Volvariella volvacea WC 439]
MPLNKLLPELIGKVLQRVAYDSLNLTSEAGHMYCEPTEWHMWTSITQFCMDWRGIVLDHSPLWIHVNTTNSRWFKAFLARSKEQLLYVHLLRTSRSQVTDAEYDEMLRVVAANMYRIRSLCLNAELLSERLIWFQNMPAPHLEALHYSGTVHDSVRSLPSSISSNIMPKLHQLHLESTGRLDCDCILPPDLPTVTNASFASTSPDSLTLLTRFKFLQRLSILWNNTPPNPLIHVALPNLEHLKIGYNNWVDRLNSHLSRSWTLWYPIILQTPSLRRFSGTSQPP